MIRSVSYNTTSHIISFEEDGRRAWEAPLTTDVGAAEYTATCYSWLLGSPVALALLAEIGATRTSEDIVEQRKADSGITKANHP